MCVYWAMKKEIEIHKKRIEYVLRTSKRAKLMRLVVYCDGNFVVTAPEGLNHEMIEQFIKKKSQWIINKLEYFKGFSEKVFIKSDIYGFAAHKEVALSLAEKKIEHFNQFYKFKFNKIAIKNQKTRWGSCSLKGNLNFNYKIALLPESVSDYIIVHELCHLGEFNHSRKFWNLVAIAIPNYLEIRNFLKKGRIHYGLEMKNA